MSEINFFAKTNFRNQQRIFGIKEDDRRRHMYVIGKTGMGKSNMLENMAIQDIQDGKGVCVVDPHGEFAERMLRAVPSERINDVVYFNPADTGFPIAFNILESVDEDKKNLVASGMMGVFKKIWPDVWSARMEYILSNTILALLDYPGSTMLGVNRMMFDSKFRKRVYGKIKDPVVKSFWINEFDQWDDRFRKEAVAAIQNKVGQFISSSIIRHIVGQPKSTIDMREIMDNQKILIVNLSKGKIGEDAMRLLGGMVVTKIQLAAMGRVDMPEGDRKDFYLYVDEFQNFATESFANILSEARKYRLNLILAHQYINQLIFDSNTVVRDAIFGNVGTLVSFRVGADDAEFLEKEFEPIFIANDLVNLAKYNIYLKLMIDGITGDAFSAGTIPPADLSATEKNEEKVVNSSRERYGKEKKKVEEKIMRWSGMGSENMEIYVRKDMESSSRSETSKNIESRTFPRKQEDSEDRDVPRQKFQEQKKEVVQKEENKEEAVLSEKEERKMYETVCDTCEEKITVPFKPDPNRPAFCKECLKDYQRLRERMKREEEENKSQNRKNFSDKEQDFSRNNSKPVSRNVSSNTMRLSQLPYIGPKKFKDKKASS